MSRSDHRCVSGKLCFRSKARAKNHIRRLASIIGGHDALTMTAYLCSTGCGLYHVGHALDFERAHQRMVRRAVLTG